MSNTEQVFIRDDYLTLVPGEPFRLLPFGSLFKGGKLRQITPEFARRFTLPSFMPPIKLGSHEDTAKAGGHIVGLEVRDDGLYAIPEWNDSGTAAISEGAYRYQSPEVVWEGGFEDSESGEVGEGPLIVGAALLHTPHLGHRAALYSVDTDGGTQMSESVTVPVSWLDRLLGRVDEPTQEPKPEPQPEPTPAGVEPDLYDAAIAERDELAARLERLEADQARAGRVDAFAAELAKHEATAGNSVLAEALADVAEYDNDLAKLIQIEVVKLGAEAAQAGITKDVGASGDGTGADPVVVFDGAVKERAAKDEITYSKAAELVAREQPELYAAYRGGA